SIKNFGTISGIEGGLSLAGGAIVVNYGTIADGGAYNFGDAIVGSGSMSVWNYGVIEGNHAISFGNQPNPSFLYNAGTIRAGGTAIQLFGTGQTDVIQNDGSIVTNVGAFAFAVSGIRNTTFTNNGSITGDVSLANSGTAVFDSSLGRVFGTIRTVNPG